MPTAPEWPTAQGPDQPSIRPSETDLLIATSQLYENGTIAALKSTREVMVDTITKGPLGGIGTLARKTTGNFLFPGDRLAQRRMERAQQQVKDAQADNAGY